MSKRYTSELAAALWEVQNLGSLLGWRAIETAPSFTKSIEAVIFVEPIEGKICGSYVGIRFHYHESILSNATIFCFYNGRLKSPCFATTIKALDWMAQIETRHNFNYHRG